jgi:hypothetical protein
VGLGICLLVLACGSPPPSSLPGGPAHAEVRDGRFVLAFDLPKDTYSTDEPIEGVATLSVDAGAAVPYGASGLGAIGFGFAEVNGPRAMGAAFTADCRPGMLIPGTPVTSPITKSGGYTEDDPLAPFYRSFFADKVVHLPPGDWKIIAFASFVEQRDCGGDAHDMTATVNVHVTP